jgi:transcriptional regulator with XRE-family HTH domain
MTLKSLRKSKKLTQAQVAQALHCHQTEVSRWETGAITPSLPPLVRMARIYEVTLATLVKAILECES